VVAKEDRGRKFVDRHSEQRLFEHRRVAEPHRRECGPARSGRTYHRVRRKDRHQHENRRPEISAKWILEKWFAPGAFDETNTEARDILLISVETGCRQSGIHDLPPDAIALDIPIPHLRCKFEEGENKWQLKNTASIRPEPVVGVALAAAKHHPQKFPRYRGKSSYSAAMNK
jgi:hypothetical protein